MEVKDFSQLTTPSPGTLAFGFLRSLSPDDQARSVQSMVATADLREGVPTDLVASFERIRSIFAYGLFYYEAFTAAEDLAWLTFEQALRERFVTFYGHEIPLISKSGEQTLKAGSFDAVLEAFGRRGQFHRGGWAVKLRSTGAAMVLNGSFRGSYGQLQRWARQEGLFAGQHNMHLEAIYRRFRNWSAHPQRHINMPSSAARTIHDLAEVINRLWGHDTPGGRLYPAPMVRTLKIIGWPNGPSSFTFTEMYPEALQHRGFDEDEDWSYVVVLAVPGADSLEDFDTQYDITPHPADLVWGPGTKAEAREWVTDNHELSDTVTYLDRVFAVRQTLAGRTYLPQRPNVALGLLPDHQDGEWHLVRADFPLAAFNHVRHGGGVSVCRTNDDLSGCAVEDLYCGPWSGLEQCLRELGADLEPSRRSRVRMPRRHPYPAEVGDD